MEHLGLDFWWPAQLLLHHAAVAETRIQVLGHIRLNDDRDESITKLPCSRWQYFQWARDEWENHIYETLSIYPYPVQFCTYIGCISTYIVYGVWRWRTASSGQVRLKIPDSQLEEAKLFTVKRTYVTLRDRIDKTNIQLINPSTDLHCFRIGRNSMIHQIVLWFIGRHIGKFQAKERVLHLTCLG